jgi:hypothetical protein
LHGIATFIFFIKKEGDMTMKKRMRRYCTLLVFAFLISLSVSQMKAVGQGQPGDRMDRAEFAKVRINRLQQAARSLQERAVEPLPANLTGDQKKEAAKYTRWLRDSGRKLNNLARRWQDALTNVSTNKSIVLSQKQMREMNISFNRQCSALRDELLDELRRYAMISRIMKNNYDDARNSINNLS